MLADELQQFHVSAATVVQGDLAQCLWLPGIGERLQQALVTGAEVLRCLLRLSQREMQIGQVVMGDHESRHGQVAIGPAIEHHLGLRQGLQVELTGPHPVALGKAAVAGFDDDFPVFHDRPPGENPSTNRPAQLNTLAYDVPQPLGSQARERTP